MYIASFNLDINFSVSSIKYNYIFRNPINEIAKNQKNFSFMSLNIQSLTSKFIEFNDMISNLNVNKCSPDVIALQEIWQIQDPAFFHSTTII